MSLQNVFGDLSLQSTQLAILEQLNADFSRILEKRFMDFEEVRYDIPNTNAGLTNGNIYIGIAEDGSATSAAVWTVVRFYFNAARKPSRSRIRKLVAWDDRAIGWS